jgi:hypothetical protein
VPAIWKTALVLPVLKPGKPPGLGTSYRPIPLLSPVVKILERLILPSLTSSLRVSSTQHGFRLFRSTTTALLPLVSMISEGFNQKKPAHRSIIVALNLSKAFNSVDITLLLNQIFSSDLHPNLVRWLSTYLRGRSAASTYQGCRSKFRRVHVGVPQGSVLSPALFNYFVSNFTAPSQMLSSFADDFSVAASCPNLQVLEEALNADMANIAAWAARKKMGS